MRLALLATILASVVLPPRSFGQNQPPGRALTAAQDSLLSARVPGETGLSIRAIIDSAHARGLPTEPLVSRALQGVQFGAPGPRVVAVVRLLADRMRTAQSVIGEQSSEAELSAAADALSIGMPQERLRTLRQSQPGRSIALPLIVLGDIVGRGVPLDTATSVILALTSAGVPEASFSALRQDIARDIASGASPGAAAQTRGRGVVIRATSSGGGAPGTPPPSGAP